ncbi:MAG: TIGR03118 family protein [Beijerinckiaceae bacterium]|nr:TIGR03118 family protein [Beijerinckiaceae bacterium]
MTTNLLRIIACATVAAALALSHQGEAAEQSETVIERNIEQHIGHWRPWFPRFKQVNLVADKRKFKAQILEPKLQNAWGIAIRPAGFGGHFWVTANTTRQSLEYVGDVGGIPLFQDELKVVDTTGTPTGVVFNAGPHFVVTQPHPAGPITAPAKFLFANDSGQITAWTERKREDGGFDRPADSVTVIDGSTTGAAFLGIGISPASSRLYAADFGAAPGLRVYDSAFREREAFPNPFQRGPTLQPGEYAPFNVQTIGKPGQERVFVMYAKTQADPKNPKAFFAGEEDAGPGKGRVAEFASGGRLISVWHGRGMLNAPWGVALAPDSFGLFGGCLLVGNFGDGTIVAFHPRWKVAIAYLLDEHGRKVKIDGLWGLQFGNGASLGEANHLYFAAGPNSETEGLFGKLAPSKASMRRNRGVSLCR